MASKGIFVFSSDVFVIIMLTEGQFDIWPNIKNNRQLKSKLKQLKCL